MYAPPANWGRIKGYETMDWVIRRWRCALVGLLTGVLIFTACTNATGVAAPQEELTAEEAAALVKLYEFDVTSSDQSFDFLAINMRLTDDGFDPASISIPIGQKIKLVVRNHGRTEHHYRIEGLVAGGLLWRQAEAATDADFTNGDMDEAMGKVMGADENDHDNHHPRASYVPYRSASTAGIEPTGTEVHAFAEGGGLDVLFFTPLNIGTFTVQDPLHPEIIGKVTVFAPDQ